MFFHTLAEAIGSSTLFKYFMQNYEVIWHSNLRLIFSQKLYYINAINLLFLIKSISNASFMISVCFSLKYSIFKIESDFKLLHKFPIPISNQLQVGLHTNDSFMIKKTSQPQNQNNKKETKNKPE